jgi:hypothetical protein
MACLVCFFDAASRGRTLPISPIRSIARRAARSARRQRAQAGQSIQLRHRVWRAKGRAAGVGGHSLYDALRRHLTRNRLVRSGLSRGLAKLWRFGGKIREALRRGRRPHRQSGRMLRSGLNRRRQRFCVAAKAGPVLNGQQQTCDSHGQDQARQPEPRERVLPSDSMFAHQTKSGAKTVAGQRHSDLCDSEVRGILRTKNEDPR